MISGYSGADVGDISYGIKDRERGFWSDAEMTADGVLGANGRYFLAGCLKRRMQIAKQSTANGRYNDWCELCSIWSLLPPNSIRNLSCDKYVYSSRYMAFDPQLHKFD